MHMVRTAWQLSTDGKELTIVLVDPRDRRVQKTIRLTRSTPMTEEQALKYVNDNYPDDGPVHAAAEALGFITRKS